MARGVGGLFTVCHVVAVSCRSTEICFFVTRLLRSEMMVECLERWVSHLAGQMEILIMRYDPGVLYNVMPPVCMSELCCGRQISATSLFL